MYWKTIRFYSTMSMTPISFEFTHDCRETLRMRNVKILSFELVTALKFSRLALYTFTTILVVLATRPPLSYGEIKYRLPIQAEVGSGRFQLCSTQKHYYSSPSTISGIPRRTATWPGRKRCRQVDSTAYLYVLIAGDNSRLNFRSTNTSFHWKLQ